MAEGNPMLALERGEKVLTPPAIWFQAHGDMMHDYKDEDSSFAGNEPQRFVANYRKAGGEIELDLFRWAAHGRSLAGSGHDGIEFPAHGRVRRPAHEGDQKAA